MVCDDFLVQYCRNLRSKDFAIRTEGLTRKKKGKREYLTDSQTQDLMRELSVFFESKVRVPRIRLGKTPTVETLMNEEALLFAKYLRNEKLTWYPTIADLS